MTSHGAPRGMAGARGGESGRALFLLAATALLLSGPPLAAAGRCPAPLDAATRLVMVTTPTMHVAQARIELFERASPDASWQPVSAPEPAVVGKSGLAWGQPFLRYRKAGEPDKMEGDKRSPAGFYRLGASFGFEPAALKDFILVKARETVCVENPASPLYNKITRRQDVDPAIHTDEMRATSLYRHGLFVDYPTDRAGRRGSCIFIHLWQSPAKGTAGCIGLPEARVKALQGFAQSGAVLGILPAAAWERFAGCLPEHPGKH